MGTARIWGTQDGGQGPGKCNSCNWGKSPRKARKSKPNQKSSVYSPLITKPKVPHDSSVSNYQKKSSKVQDNIKQLSWTCLQKKSPWWHLRGNHSKYQFYLVGAFLWFWRKRIIQLPCSATWRNQSICNPTLHCSNIPYQLWYFKSLLY